MSEGRKEGREYKKRELMKDGKKERVGGKEGRKEGRENRKRE